MGAPGRQEKGKEGVCKVGGLCQEAARNGEETSGDLEGESPAAPGGRKLGESRPMAFSRFLHFALLFWNQTWTMIIMLKLDSTMSQS